MESLEWTDNVSAESLDLLADNLDGIRVDIILGVLGGLLILVLPAIYYFFGDTIAYVFSAHIVPAVAKFWLNLIGVFAIGVIAWILNWFKRKSRLAYGVTEIVFGTLLLGWNGVDKLHLGGWTEIAAVVGAVYFTVRGLDNLFSALEERKARIQERERYNYNLPRRVEIPSKENDD